MFLIAVLLGGAALGLLNRKYNHRYNRKFYTYEDLIARRENADAQA